MPVCEKWSYLDHAAVAPLTRGAQLAIQQFADQAANEGDTVWPQWAGEIELLRKDFADLLHCQTTELALVPNTSYGINVVAEGLRWRSGDNVVIPAGEFPSNRLPWLNQQRKGVEVRIVGSSGDLAVDESRVLEAMDSRTRLVAASWVGYATGYRLNLEDLVQKVHQRGALFFLDAIQGLGVFPLDLSSVPIDFLAADGHKWLLGPEGAGILMIRDSQLNELDCVPVGWSSVKAAHQFDNANFDLRPTAARYEIGSQNMVGMRALRQSLGIFQQVIATHGHESIADRILHLSDYLIDGLQDRGAKLATHAQRAHRSGIVTFAMPDTDSSIIRQQALRQGVVVSCRGIGVRASVHAYNHEDDIDRLLSVL